MIIQSPKSLENVQEPVALDENYYLMRISGEPEVKPSKKKRDGVSEADGAGDNLVIKLRVQSDNPEENGRGFTIWLGIPNEADKTRTTQQGQTFEDWKLARMAKVAAAFAGGELAPDTEEFDFSAGMEAYFYVNAIPKEGGGGMENPLLDYDTKPPMAV